MPQPQSRQQSQFNEVQMLQQQIMLKHLQELQRQKKFQELSDSRQQNVINQQSLIHNKQAPEAQYSPLINGTPVRDASQMFMFGNTNMVQGFPNRLVYSQGQNQVLHSMGLDGHSFGEYSHFQGASHESAGVLTKQNREQQETFSKSSTNDQLNVSLNQERDMFGPVFTRGLDVGGQTGDLNNHERDASSQEFGRGQEQGGLATLDPLEQKILFNTDDDNGWGASLENMFENTDHLSAFPSVQSGSWSALMQSAVDEAATGTDTGIREEWSGLSFQNQELSNDNQPSNFVKTGEHPSPWKDNLLQTASSLRPKSELIRTSNASSSFPGFQQYPATHFPKEAGERLYCGAQQKEPLEVATFDRSVGFPALNSSAQTSRNMLELLHKVDKFGEYRPDTQPGYADSAPTNETPKAEHGDAFTLSYNNSSTSQYFGLRLAPPTQRPPMNHFDPSQTSQQPGHSIKAPMSYAGSRYPAFNLDDSHETSHVVPVKNQDGQKSSIFDTKQPSGMVQEVANPMRPPNVWVDVPSQQNPDMGFRKAPSGSFPTLDDTNSMTETASEATKELDNQKYVKGGNDYLETGEHVMNSQGFDYGKGQAGEVYFGEESFSGLPEANASSSLRNLEAFGRSSKQAHVSSQSYSLLNPMYSDPNIRAAIKNERADSEHKIPQMTSMSQLSSAYGNYRNLSQSPLQDTSQLHRNSSFVQMNMANTGYYGSVWPVAETNSTTHLSSPYLQHLDVPNQNLVVLKSKKRKFPTYERLPWHKEAAKGSSRPQDMSIAELEWAEAANRLPEKLNEEAEALGDLPRIVHPKKRLILTTQLMQLLFRPAPTIILSDDATAHYSTVTYFAARLALGDACGLANHSHTPSDISYSSLGKNVASKSSGGQDLSKIIEDFIDRSKRLEDELLRLENGGSILDIRTESQELEKFSVINRFAKFHSRAQLVAAETGASTLPKLYPQRYVTASPMPKMVPEGQHCLSL